MALTLGSRAARKRIPTPSQPPAVPVRPRRVAPIAGLQVAEITPSLRTHYGAPEDAGVLVVRADSERLKELADIRVGDVIVSVGRQPIRSERQLRSTLSSWDFRSPIEVSLVRDREKQTLTVEPPLESPTDPEQDRKEARTQGAGAANPTRDRAARTTVAGAAAPAGRGPTETLNRTIRLVLMPLVLLLAGTLRAEREVSTLLSDLEGEVRSKLAALDPPVASLATFEQLDAVFQAVSPYEFDAAVLIAYTDKRWFSTILPGGPEAPILELRRWPGDTILTLYALAGPPSHVRDARPPVSGAELRLVDGSTPDLAEWSGTLETEAGSRPAIWLEIQVGEASAYLGALMLPGSAGLGEAAVASLTDELRAVVGRLVIRETLWERSKGVAHGTHVLVPETGSTPLDKSELRHPWQVAEGSSFSIGLPRRIPRPTHGR